MFKEEDSNWSKLEKNCETNCQFMRKSWFDSWNIYEKAENSNWYGGINYDFVEDNGVAVLPYSYQRLGPFKFASVAGCFFPHRGIPHTNNTYGLIEKLAVKVQNIKDVDGFRIGPVEDSDSFVLRLSENLRDKKWRMIRTSLGQNYGLHLPDNVDEYMATISSKRLKKIRYYSRKLDKEGNVELKHFCGETPESWKKVFEDLATIESNAWVSRSGDPRFMGDLHRTFWNEVVKDDVISKLLNVCILYLDEKPVSQTVGIDSGYVRHVLASSYDEKVSNFNTGIRLEIALNSQAIEKGIKYINNGLGDSGYKSAWGSELYNELFDIVLFPPTIKGWITYQIAKLKKKADK